MKYELIFDDYDLNKDHSLDFEGNLSLHAVVP